MATPTRSRLLRDPGAPPQVHVALIGSVRSRRRRTEARSVDRLRNPAIPLSRSYGWREPVEGIARARSRSAVRTTSASQRASSGQPIHRATSPTYRKSCGRLDRPPAVMVVLDWSVEFVVDFTNRPGRDVPIDIQAEGTRFRVSTRPRALIWASETSMTATEVLRVSDWAAIPPISRMRLTLRAWSGGPNTKTKSAAIGRR